MFSLCRVRWWRLMVSAEGSSPAASRHPAQPSALPMPLPHSSGEQPQWESHDCPQSGYCVWTQCFSVSWIFLSFLLFVCMCEVKWVIWNKASVTWKMTDFSEHFCFRFQVWFSVKGVPHKTWFNLFDTKYISDIIVIYTMELFLWLEVSIILRKNNTFLTKISESATIQWMKYY